MADTYDLNLVQGERYERGFRWKVVGVAQDLSAYSWRAQARAKEAHDSDLILSLTEYLSLNPDTVTLDLNVPASVTFAIPKIGSTAAWDLFIWPTADPDDKRLLIQGAATLDRSATDLS